MADDKLEAVAKAAIGETAKQTIGPLLRDVAAWAVAPLGVGTVTTWTLFQFASYWARAHPFLTALAGVVATVAAGVLSWRALARPWRARFAALEKQLFFPLVS